MMAQNNAQEAKARPWRAFSSGTTDAYFSGRVKPGNRKKPAARATTATAARRTPRRIKMKEDKNRRHVVEEEEAVHGLLHQTGSK